MIVKIILERRRFLVHAFGWSVIDLDVLTRLPAPKPASPGRPVNPPQDRDMTGTVCSQVEQADEPAPGFGFAGTAGTVLARKDRP